MPESSEVLRRRAIRIDQDPEHPLYIFSLTGAELLQIADISRISRDNNGRLRCFGLRNETRQHRKTSDPRHSVLIYSKQNL